MKDGIKDLFEVTVKCREEVGMKKNGDPKYKTFTEKYLVRAGSCGDAEKAAMKEMDGVTFEWHVSGSKESNITGYLDNVQNS